MRVTLASLSQVLLMFLFQALCLAAAFGAFRYPRDSNSLINVLIRISARVRHFREVRTRKTFE